MKRNLALLLGAMLIAGCAAPANEHAGHVTTPTISVDDAVPASYGGTLLNAAMTDALLALKFTDQHSRAFTLKDYQGKSIVIANFLTSCQDAGPLTATNIRAAAKALARSTMNEQVVFMLISVDAGTDNPSRLQAYSTLFSFTDNVVLATADAATLDTLWNFFGVPATKHELAPADIAAYPHDWQTGKLAAYHFMHANIVALIDANSTWRWMQSGNPDIEAHEMPEAMKNFLSPSGATLAKQHDEFSWRVSQVVSAINDVMGHSINS